MGTMIDRSNDVKSDDDMMAAVGIWVLVSLVVLIGGVALLYYLRYVQSIVCCVAMLGDCVCTRACIRIVYDWIPCSRWPVRPAKRVDW